MNRPVYITAAARSPVAPRHGALSKLSIAELGAPVVRSLLQSTASEQADMLICGNGLYGGGNPARLIALASAIDESLPAFTIDTQCCAGLDALQLAHRLIETGRNKIIIAGGAESFSRSPIRLSRPLNKNEDAIAYDRPPFTPWSDRDPDMIEAAADLAHQKRISRQDQETFAIASHATASTANQQGIMDREIVCFSTAAKDTFTRRLSPQLCARAHILAGKPPFEITSATTAVEADGAAFLMLSSSPPKTGTQVRVVDALSSGGDPSSPGLAPISAAQKILERNSWNAADLKRVEIMEAFSAQALAFVNGFDFSNAHVNGGGGALARGHPIGASGAILAVRLYHDLCAVGSGARGLAAIAGAGGLASVLLMEVD